MGSKTTQLQSEYENDMLKQQPVLATQIVTTVTNTHAEGTQTISANSHTEGTQTISTCGNHDAWIGSMIVKKAAVEIMVIDPDGYYIGDDGDSWNEEG